MARRRVVCMIDWVMRQQLRDRVLNLLAEKERRLSSTRLQSKQHAWRFRFTSLFRRRIVPRFDNRHREVQTGLVPYLVRPKNGRVGRLIHLDRYLIFRITNNRVRGKIYRLAILVYQ